MQDEGERLAGIVDDVLASYVELGHINHLDGTRLPTRGEVDALLEDLLALVFPGFHGAEDLDALNLRWVVGERSARVVSELEHLLTRARTFHVSPCQPSADAPEDARGIALDLLAALPAIRAILAVDIHAAFAGDPAACSPEEIITSYPGVLAVTVHRLAHHLYLRGVPLLPRMMSETAHARTGIDVHPGATIGKGFFIDHGTGVVVGETARIGEFVTLYQGVTLGALSIKAGPNRRDRQAQRHPTLEERVTVYAGATILGGDTVIGEGSVIGGNVWLTQSVPPRTTVVIDRPSLRLTQHSDGAAQPSALAADPSGAVRPRLAGEG